MKPTFFALWLLATFSHGATAQSNCATSVVTNCISTAVISICDNISNSACICGSSGEAALASWVAGCLLVQSCPLPQLISLAGAANSVCVRWNETHLTTVSTAVSTTSSSTFASLSIASPGVTATLGVVVPSSTTISTGAALTSSASRPAEAPRLAKGAAVGVSIGAIAAFAAIVLSVLLFLRRRRISRNNLPGVQELPLQSRDQDLPPYSKSPAPVTSQDIELQDLHESSEQADEDFMFPFQPRPTQSETRAGSSRSRLPTGDMDGTEATVFDIDSQKVLLGGSNVLKAPGLSSTGDGPSG